MEEKLILNSDGTQKPNEKSIGFLPLSAVSSSLSTCGSLAIYQLLQRDGHLEERSIISIHHAVGHVMSMLFQTLVDISGGGGIEAM